ncbi:MAG: hypothetical protein O9290_15710 [Microcystis sp. LE19-41.2A]|nr:hypothetical protein [Microcystis sp. LE19-41.2A]MCZ8048037.1 hypothetical protein [Microcystis sp. LE19-41.2A]
METILIYKLPKLNRKEIEAILCTATTCIFYSRTII